MKRKTFEEVKELYIKLNNNVDNIPNYCGRGRIKEQIKILKEYIDNPGMNINNEIDNSSGERQRMFRWIQGDLV